MREKHGEIKRWKERVRFKKVENESETRRERDGKRE